MRRTLLLCALCVSVVGCASKDKEPAGDDAGKSARAKAANEATGKALAMGLLRELVDTFGSLARSANAEVGIEAFEDLRKKAVSARHLPEEFERRYFAMLDAVLVVLHRGDEPDPKQEEKVKAFVEAVGGPDAAYDPKGGLASIAGLMVEEVVALRLLVDPSASREDVQKEYFPQR